MVFDLDVIQAVYAAMPANIDKARQKLNRPLTLSEKILFSHLAENLTASIKRGGDYLNFSPDRVAMQDATAQMALLQFILAEKTKTSVPTTVHCDHLILASSGAKEDVSLALSENKEVYDFLQSVSDKYGIGFWKPGAGIIHQVILEHYGFPGGMMIGTDSHTVNAGGLGMIAIGVGGSDAMDVMAGMTWELKLPKLIGVHLKGKLNGWTSPKDVILKLAGILTVKGGTNAIIEYFGEGTKTISCTGKATICNMGAEVGATTSIFGYDQKMQEYLQATGRQEIASMADAISNYLNADPEVLLTPEKFYDQVIEIDLTSLEPYINGPFSPDVAHPISEFSKAIKEHQYPEKLEVGLIGSCTNSSYEDLTRSAFVVRDARSKKLKSQSEFIITPGSDLVYATAKRDGLLQDFENIGGIVMANACGPCIGQWKRHNARPDQKNSILTSFNRNFAKRNDGNPNTFAFVASPEIVTALTIAGRISFNPLTDSLLNSDGAQVKLSEPKGEELPVNGFETTTDGYLSPTGKAKSVAVSKTSDRLQLLAPFKPWHGKDFESMPVLIKAKGKCTTDHISMAGLWLTYRGHLDKISDNLLMGAVNAFNDETNKVKNIIDGTYAKVSEVARAYKTQRIQSIVVAEENYGEGSSREHAAMEPRHLNVAVILVKSFARIHETNLKKQGMLALTFSNKNDYEKIREDDRIDVVNLKNFSANAPLHLILNHNDGSCEAILALHSYNDVQIEWFKAGSALNKIANDKMKN